MSWTGLDCTMRGVPNNDHLLASIDADAGTEGRAGKTDPGIVGAYGRDSRASDSNGTAWLRLASNNRLPVANKCLSTPKGKHVAYVHRSREPSRVRETH